MTINPRFDSEKLKHDPAGLSQFDAPTPEQWKEAAVVALKGASVEDKLVTRTLEKVAIQPIYPFAAETREELKAPGQFPFRRGTGVSSRWQLAQSYSCADPGDFNSIVLEELSHGLSCAVLRPDYAGQGGLRIQTLSDLSIALSRYPLSEKSLWIDSGAHFLSVGALLASFSRNSQGVFSPLAGVVGGSFYAEWVGTGALPTSLDSLHDDLATWTRFAQSRWPSLRTVIVRSSPYHDGGANAVDEVAFVLAECAALIRELMTRGLSASQASRAIAVQVSSGTSFFMEIAKIRALRVLFAGLARSFGADNDSARPFLHAITSQRSQALYEPAVNILRAATAAFSAVLGGVDSVETLPFDRLERDETQFSRRVARNIQLLLKEESGVAAVADPIGGSRVIESMTDSLAQAAWKQFQVLEAEGGLAASLAKGTPQQWVRDSRDKRAARIGNRRDVIVGTNMYPEAGSLRSPVSASMCADTVEGFGKTSVAYDFASVKRADFESLVFAAQAGASVRDMEVSFGYTDAGDRGLIEKIPFCRLAEPFEKIRRDIAALPKSPAVFLARFVARDAHRLRAGFAKGFFSVAGIQVTESSEATAPEVLLRECVNSGATVVVLCSSDDAYPALVAAVAMPIKNAVPGLRVVLAGNPGEKESEYRALGVDDFIHLGTDIPQKLASLFLLSEVHS